MFLLCDIVGTDYNTLEFFIKAMHACFFSVTWLVHSRILHNGYESLFL
jgi:hypothetical protein